MLEAELVEEHLAAIRLLLGLQLQKARLELEQIHLSLMAVVVVVGCLPDKIVVLMEGQAAAVDQTVQTAQAVQETHLPHPQQEGTALHLLQVKETTEGMLFSLVLMVSEAVGAALPHLV